MAMFIAGQVKKFMQAYYKVLSVYDLRIYSGENFGDIREAVETGREVPKELRDEPFNTALSELERMIPYMLYLEIEHGWNEHLSGLVSPN